MNKFKLFYILSVIVLAISAIGGIVAISGFFFKNPIVQLVGVIILISAFVISMIFDFVSKKIKK